jgi:hypothetical protein
VPSNPSERRRAMRRLGALLVATTVIMVGLGATPAAAAPPSNDRESGAIAIGPLPFTTSQDTSEATAGGPRFCASRASVFYSLSSAVTQRVQVDTIGSDYDTVLAVYRRTAAGRVRALDCNDDRFGVASGVRFRAAAGKTYFLMVGQCCSNVGGGGGELVLTATQVADVPLQFSLDVTGGTVDQATGLATLNGTLTCNERAFVFRDMMLRQLREGIFVARGFVGLEVSCTPGVVEQWSVEVDTETGIAFGPGPALLRTFFEFATDGFRDFIEDVSVPDEQVTLS